MKLVLPTSVRGNDRSGVGGGGDVCPPPPEYHRPVYHDLSNNGDMSGGGETAGSAVDVAVVVAVWNQLRTRVWEVGGGGGLGRGRVEG